MKDAVFGPVSRRFGSALLRFGLILTLSASFILYNRPWIFNGCWYIIKPWIDPVTASKVTFVNEKELKQIIPPASLPTDLGGESTYDFAASYVPLADRPAKTEEVSTESTNEPSTPSKVTEDSDDFSTSASTSASTSERKEKRKKKSKRSKKTIEETTTEDDETIVTTTITSVSTITIEEDVVVDE